MNKEKLASRLPVVFSGLPLKLPEGIYWMPEYPDRGGEMYEFTLVVHWPSVEAYAADFTEAEEDLFIQALGLLTMLVAERTGGDVERLNHAVYSECRKKLGAELPDAGEFLDELWGGQP